MLQLPPTGQEPLAGIPERFICIEAAFHRLAAGEDRQQVATAGKTVRSTVIAAAISALQ